MTHPVTRHQPIEPIKKRAIQALNAFQDSELPGVWPHLDKATIAADMRRHLHNPYTVNQGIQPFCGPASILFELICKDPLAYVNLCRDLFETGGFDSRNCRITASAALRHASQGELHMDMADWLVLATLRESENLIFPVEPNAPEIVRNLAGMTKSWEMKGWVREILGYEHVDYLHAYILRDLRVIKQAKKILDQGGVALALITADSLLNPNRTPLITVPNHWIAITGNIQVEKGTFGRHDSGHVSFDCFTWARKAHISADEGTFEDGFWGVVLGW